MNENQVHTRQEIVKRSCLMESIDTLVVYHVSRLYRRPFFISQPSQVDNVVYYNPGENRIHI